MGGEQAGGVVGGIDGLQTAGASRRAADQSEGEGEEERTQDSVHGNQGKGRTWEVWMVADRRTIFAGLPRGGEANLQRARAIIDGFPANRSRIQPTARAPE